MKFIRNLTFYIVLLWSKQERKYSSFWSIWFGRCNSVCVWCILHTWWLITQSDQIEKISKQPLRLRSLSWSEIRCGDLCQWVVIWKRVLKCLLRKWIQIKIAELWIILFRKLVSLKVTSFYLWSWIMTTITKSLMIFSSGLTYRTSIYVFIWIVIGTKILMGSVRMRRSGLFWVMYLLMRIIIMIWMRVRMSPPSVIWPINIWGVMTLGIRAISSSYCILLTILPMFPPIWVIHTVINTP